MNNALKDHMQRKSFNGQIKNEKALKDHMQRKSFNGQIKDEKA